MADNASTAGKSEGTAYTGKSESKGSSSLLALLVGVAVFIIVTGAAYTMQLGYSIWWGLAGFIVYFALSIRILAEWKRTAVLTLGRYSGIYGPGIFLIIPMIQSTPYTYDLRTFSTTFSAEKTLTSDNVTVDVDAIMFSKVEAPEKTVLQVSNMDDSVTLAAQTALRDIIGQVDLSKMIQGRSEIADEVKALIDERVLPWGVNVISVELRDVRIPAALQDAMARVAVASRERDARVVLAESEKLAAQKMIDASNTYGTNHFAMQLRALNILYEIGLSGKNNIIFIPTESRGLGMPTPVGIFGFDNVKSGKLNFTAPGSSGAETDNAGMPYPAPKKQKKGQQQSDSDQ